MLAVRAQHRYSVRQTVKPAEYIPLIIMKCPNCGVRMSYNDETTKLTEFVCNRCHQTIIEYKSRARTVA